MSNPPRSAAAVLSRCSASSDDRCPGLDRWRTQQTTVATPLDKTGESESSQQFPSHHRGTTSYTVAGGILLHPCFVKRVREVKACYSFESRVCCGLSLSVLLHCRHSAQELGKAGRLKGSKQQQGGNHFAKKHNTNKAGAGTQGHTAKAPLQRHNNKNILTKKLFLAQ